MISGAQTTTLYFDISGMTCAAGCAARIESDLKEKFEKEHIEKEEGEVVVDFPSRRAKVVVPTYIKPQTIIKWVKEIDPKFSAHYIPAGYETTVCFSVKGLKIAEDAQKIQEMLLKQETLVADSTVYWATKTIKTVIVMPVKPEKKQQTIDKLKSDIIELFPDRKLEINQIETPDDETYSRIETKEYLYKSFLNVVVGAAFLFLSGYIPLPITFLGQLVGLGIGAITLSVMWVTGKEFYQSAWREFWHKRSFNMNTLISLGTGSAFFYSMMLVLVPWLFPIAALQQYQFLAVNMILGIFNFGRAVRSHAEEEARQNTKKISNVYVAMQPQWVKKLSNYPDNFDEPIPEDLIEEVHYSQIKKGDILRVDTDEYVAVEGEILNQVETSVNQEAMTGESVLCKKSKGDKLYSGTLNKGSPIFIRASCAGEDARLIKIINDSTKPRDATSVSKNIDKIAKYFVPAIMLFALASGFGWFLFGTAPVLPLVIKTIMAVLLCACPCALALATPISLANAYRQLLKHHIWVHDATAIEALSKTSAVVCDKTGTLTFPVYHEIFAEDPELDREDILQYAARLEREVDHPIATAFNNAAIHYKKAVKKMVCHEVIKGEQGLSGLVDGKAIHLGTAGYLSSQEIPISEGLRAKEKEYAGRGMTSVYVAVNKKCVAIVALEHQIRPEAKSDIEYLRKMGIQVYMATGDKKEITEKVATALGFLPQNVKAELSPAAKKAWIQALQKEGAVVAMVGDNVNDNPALNIADASVAVGPWTNATSKSSVTIKTINIATLILICRKTMENIYLNVIWALGYNAFSLAAASGALNPLGILLGPLGASFSMACSSLGVVLNSSRLNSTIEESLRILKGKPSPNPPGFWARIKPMNLLRSVFSALRAFLSVIVEKPKTSPPSPPRRSRQNIDFTKVRLYDHKTRQFVRDGKPDPFVLPGTVNTDIDTILDSAPAALEEGGDLSLSGSPTVNMEGNTGAGVGTDRSVKRNLMHQFNLTTARVVKAPYQADEGTMEERAAVQGINRPIFNQ